MGKIIKIFIALKLLRFGVKLLPVLTLAYLAYQYMM